MAKHIYHYNVHSEKRYFLNPYRDMYDIICFNGNIVSYTPAAIAALVATTCKPFFIDPQTYIFQHNTNYLKKDVSDKGSGNPPKLEFKKSIIKLAKERLCHPFSLVIENDKPLKIEDFKNNGTFDLDLIKSFTKCVLEFQENVVNNSLNEDDKAYIESDKLIKPEFLISPYFYLQDDNFVEWLDLNIECYKASKDISKTEYNNKDVFFMVILSTDILDDFNDELSKKIEDINSIDGMLIWIDGHEEETLSKLELKTYYEFLKNIKKHTNIIYNIHGGYFSLLLSHNDKKLLNGLGHAINYGESRGVVPVGGGIPLARFYYPDIHSRLKFVDSLSIVLTNNYLSSEDIYYENVCKCNKCIEMIRASKTVEDAFNIYGVSKSVTSARKNFIVNLNYPTAETREAASLHYLFNKHYEFQKMNAANTLNDLVNELKHTYDKFSINTDLKIIAHLLKWHKVLIEKI